MPSVTVGAQEASRRTSRFALIGLISAALAVAGLGATPRVTHAATAPKVVVVVGPVGTTRTAEFIADAKVIASQARAYGARVYEVYSPNATWSRVKQVAQGANLLVYLGHGNGWPSPYGPFSGLTKDGMGLNAVANSGHRNTKYYGETILKNELRLAPNAVVLLHRLCYASGNSEPGHADPTLSVAHQRVDNFGAGFLRTGAKAVFVDGWKSTSYVIYGLFKTDRTFSQIFWSASHAVRTYSTSFASVRTPGAQAVLDPYAKGDYYRSVVGTLSVSASTWRG